MKRATKIIGAVLLTAFITVSVFGVFPAPKKAEATGVAFAACLAAKIADGLAAVLKAVPASILSVNTSDLINTEGTAEAAAGDNWVMCFLKGLAVTIARTLLHTFTQSIVNWINRGFEGEPSFVTDVGGFFTDVADQAFGEVIGLISPLLCTPFRFDIRASLGLQASLSGTEQIRCRLSDVFANVDGGFQQFVSGSFSSGGGWNSWINISGTPQNNPYGAHLNTQSYVGARIVTATGKEIKLLDFGNGFKSWRPCKIQGDPIVVKNRDGSVKEKNGVPKTRKGPCKEYDEIRTPGSVIANTANASLNSTLEELQVADDIDAVVGALINQLMIKAVTGVGGLLGASKSDSTSGGKSATGSLATDPLKVRASATTRPPAGIDCSQRYYPSVVVTLNGIRPNDSENIVYTDQFVDVPLLDSQGEEVKDAEGNVIKKKVVAVVDGQILTVPAEDANGNVLKKQQWEFGAGQTWEEYFEIVRVGCQNETLRILDSETDKARSESGTNVTAPNAPTVTTKSNPPVEGNISRGKYADMSSVLTGQCIKDHGPSNDQDLNAQNAVNGGTSGNYHSGLSATGCGTGNQWWLVDLTRDNPSFSNTKWVINGIDQIKIYGATDNRYGYYSVYDSNNPFYVYVTKTDPRIPSMANETQFAQNATGSNPPVLHIGKYYLDAALGKNNQLIPVGTSNATVVDGAITFPGGLKGGNYVIVRRASSAPYNTLGLAEVEVFGTQTRVDPNNPDASVTPPEQEFQVQLNPSSINLANATGGNDIGSNASLNLTATKVGEGVSLRISMFEKASTDNSVPYKPDPIQLHKYFQNLSVSVTQDGVASTTILVYPAGTPGTCFQATPCTNTSLPTPKTNTHTFDEDRVLPVNKVVPVSLKGQYSSSLAQNTYKFLLEVVNKAGDVIATGELIAKTQAP